ncbi:MAG: EAL domain-containing protein [Geminicoccaceae bacterium]|nr:EAL domain-containing protein [Geminicoccaceae bacterium]MCX8101154.1 EAL domain-containing protein [Geminicoccaceae bacterium]MDW8370130.1 EAL domain-containing protein [Geminicoccaceae bacterium]
MATIVVIDDRVTGRNILTRLARSVEEGLQVHAFASAKEALARMTSDLQPDLVITDYNMPEMDGATLIAAIRATESLADVPVVVVTVYEDRDFCYRALEAGATDFLLSPVDHLEFRARARNLLALRRQRLLLARRAAELERALAETGAPWREADTGTSLLDQLPVAICTSDPQGRLTFVNRAYETLFGVEREQVIGRTLLEIHGEDFATRHRVLDEKVRESGQPLLAPRYDTMVGPAGLRWLAVTKAPLCERHGGERVVTVALDISELKLAETAGSEAGRHDPLTGLETLPWFRERLEQAIARARRQGELLAVLHLDLDRFKGVNEAFGEAAGDKLLRAVAQRIAGRLRESDRIARLRSDELVILQGELKRAEDAAELCRRLNEAFAEPFHADGQEIHLSASIGVTLYPTDGRTAETLLRNADLAMYRAKASGRDAYRFFAREMNLAARRAVTLERELRQALAAEQFLVHYQPQMDLASRRIVGIEALVRWNHPHRGLLRPGEFIRLAEEIGLIAPLTAWVLQTACSQHRRWNDAGLGRLQLSVNLSPVQFRERGVELLIERVLKESGLSPQQLDVELTENAIIENSQTASASLRYLHQLGVSLSLDDFGTGYSSLSYVKRLPVRRLKIDQSFVQNLEQSVNDEVIVRAIINLGHSLGLTVIAEGVETPGQLNRLVALGCNEAQGDFISPPLSAAEFERRMLEGAWAGVVAEREAR